MPKYRRRIVAMALALAAGGSAAAEDARLEPAAYRIGLGDVLRVTVWKEPELTGEVTVRPDGMITLPLVGDVPAAGRVPSQLATSLVAEFERMVEKPRVTVSVSQAVSARVYVVGQVMRPGEYPVSGRLTVLKALALAGGFKDFARSDNIVIVREDLSVVPFNYKRLAEGKDVSQNAVLGAGDTVVVP